MEGVDGSPNDYRYTLGEDIISSMPNNVMNNILERLPIHEAVRTGILSRAWRYKWTMLSQLVFDTPFSRYCGKIISRLLLHLKGPITNFVLWIPKGCYPEIDEQDINNWILFLSQKGLKQLTLINHEHHPFRLTSHIFSCLELSHLELYNFQLGPVPDLRGIGSLTKLSDLCVNFKNCKVLEDARRSVPTALVCLKKLKLYIIDLSSKTMASLVVKLICASPNLHYLEIVITCEHGSSEVDYSIIKQLQLQKVKLYRVKGSKSEECLIKSLLACSPLLKKMSITVDTPEVFGDFTTNLLKLHRASPRAKLKLVHDPRSEPFLCFYL
ncbi:F-box/FBD/LRR-repeat protein-like protein [Tanacetum coccineum]